MTRVILSMVWVKASHLSGMKWWRILYHYHCCYIILDGLKISYKACNITYTLFFCWAWWTILANKYYWFSELPCLGKTERPSDALLWASRCNHLLVLWLSLSSLTCYIRLFRPQRRWSFPIYHFIVKIGHQWIPYTN